MPPGKVHEPAFLWFGLPGRLLKIVRSLGPVLETSARSTPNLREVLLGAFPVTRLAGRLSEISNRNKVARFEMAERSLRWLCTKELFDAMDVLYP